MVDLCSRVIISALFTGKLQMILCLKLATLHEFLVGFVLSEVKGKDE